MDILFTVGYCRESGAQVRRKSFYGQTETARPPGDQPTLLSWWSCYAIYFLYLICSRTWKEVEAPYNILILYTVSYTWRNMFYATDLRLTLIRAPIFFFSFLFHFILFFIFFYGKRSEKRRNRYEVYMTDCKEKKKGRARCISHFNMLCRYI